MQKIVTNLYSKTPEEVSKGQEERFKSLFQVLQRLEFSLKDKSERINSMERFAKVKLKEFKKNEIVGMSLKLLVNNFNSRETVMTPKLDSRSI